MSDEKTESAGFDIGKYIKDGLGSGLKSAAWSTGKYVLGQALLAAGVDPELLKKPEQKILDELGVLKTMIGEVQTRLEGLSQEITTQTASLEESIKAAGLDKPMRTIDGRMVKLCSLFAQDASCFRLSLFQSQYQTGARAGAPSPPRPTETQLRDMAEDIRKNVEEAMNEIRSGLVGSRTERGYLDVLADSIIHKMGTRGDLFGWYLFFEGRTLEFVTELLYGMVLKVNSLTYLEDGFDPDHPDAPATHAIHWLNTIYAGVIGQVVSAFQGTAERLVLSRYDPLAQASEPGFASEEDLQKIFSRVDLLSWMLTVQDPEETDPGVRVRRFLRSSQIQGEGGPELHPGTGYEPATGSLVGIPGMYSGDTGGARMPYWYKCVDLLESDRYLTMATFEESDIRIVRYRWPWPKTKPPVGAPLGDGLFTRVVPRWFDKSSLLEVAGPSPEAVLLASFTEARSILDDLLLSPAGSLPTAGKDGKVAPWEYESFVDPKKKDHAKELLRRVEDRQNLTTRPFTSKLSLTVPPVGGFGTKGPARYKHKVKRNVLFSDRATDVTKINVVIGGSWTVDVPQTGHYATSGMGGGMVDQSPFVRTEMIIKALSFPSAAQDNDRDDDSIQVLHEQEYTSKSTVDATEEVAILDSFNLKTGEYHEIQWRIYMTALEQGKAFGPTFKENTDAQAEHQISYFRYAWDPPKLAS